MYLVFTSSGEVYVPSIYILWWSLCTLYLHACQVRVTIGDSGLCCCGCVMYFERQWTPLRVDSACALWASFCFRFVSATGRHQTCKITGSKHLVLTCRSNTGLCWVWSTGVSTASTLFDRREDHWSFSTPSRIRTARIRESVLSSSWLELLQDKAQCCNGTSGGTVSYTHLTLPTMAVV